MLDVTKKIKLTRSFYTRRKLQLTNCGYTLDKIIAKISSETNCNIGYVWRFYYHHDPKAVRPEKRVGKVFDIKKAANSVLNRGKNQCGYFLLDDTICTHDKQRGSYCQEHYAKCFVSVSMSRN